ncbi:MAG: DEAD/DEAH box helicase [Mizugakiibacter sp.]|uniref:DEAD/DEAH box helicase n=1 Tax=Mizugakiibacter sp. TaxID=1972610 RepID=UPI0031C34347|nr:DEAD/DEAH box helicase [Xanthomonadaceae bacterium]
MTMPLESFHPAVAAWFRSAFGAATPAQERAWPAIQSGRHALIAAPTGSGKTLAAFLAAVDALVREGLAGGLPDATAVVYVSPLKALSNDIHLNLEVPLSGIRAELERLGLPDVDIRTAVRTGDTPAAERTLMRKRPPHVLVTTPESLYVLLGSDSGRRMLAGTRTVIVDEIHAIAASKRGSHLALSLERLQALCPRPLVRIGLSATQKPVEDMARLLVGTRIDGRDAQGCEIVDIGYTRRRDLAIEVPPVPLEAVMSNDAWALVYTRLAELVEAHRTTLVFVNTRRMAERAARHLGERLGNEAVAAHHGSLAREQRLDAERRLKRGELRVLVATASLELGIDVGDVDLVCQIGSPHGIAAFLQRVGRSGHSVGGTPKGRLFPQSRDDLVECAALLDCVRRGELDALRVPLCPLDVLAQQIVAEVACREWEEDALYAAFCRAWPYAALTREAFDEVVRMLAEGFSTRRGARAAYLHRDAVHGRLRGRRGARLTALTSGGTIPDTADYAVLLEPQAQVIGSVNEDFAVESSAGDIFQLGNASYRIQRIEPGRLRVEDARGMPPSIPFWLGEAPGRSDELSAGVARLREEVERRLAGANAGEEEGLPLRESAEAADEPRSPRERGRGERPVSPEGPAPAEPLPPTPLAMGEGSGASAVAWLVDEVGIAPAAARQLVEYLARARAALGALPTQRVLAMERFFDESGGTQLVIHAPLGSRINKAWGLALRKRFCRKFNFELQAAATEDAIVLSLSTSHSFPLIDVARYLHSSSVRDVLVQALLGAPLFPVRWRWAATTALALPRFIGGSKVAPQLQRMKSEDLLATVFPDQVACAENIVGEREVPDHPLVRQTLDDCLHEAMDLGGLIRLLRALESGAVCVIARDLPEPSPLAAEVLGARPYAFLDDAPLEERRTQAVLSRRWSDPESAADLGRLDPPAIEAVRAEAWPEARDADELHEALMGVAFLTVEETARDAAWPTLLQALAADGRATRLALPRESGAALWVATERVPMLRAAHADARPQPEVRVPDEFAQAAWTREDALVEIVRARLTALGPTTAAAIAASLQVAAGDVNAALLRLESEGYAMRGRFTPEAAEDEWCERHLLARIHRYTVHRLRREIEPVEARDFMRFLFEWQHASPRTQVAGPEALAGVVAQLEGYEAAAAAWEAELLPARIPDYSIAWLDDLCRSGRLAWTRLKGRAAAAAGRAAGPVRGTPIVLLPRRALALWTSLATPAPAHPSSRAQAVLQHLDARGASFFDEIADATRLLQTELEDALGELVARGLAHADSFAGLRALLVPASKRPSAHGRRGRRVPLFGIADAGRWAPIRAAESAAPAHDGFDADTLEHVARTLLRRYGVVFWRLLEREADWLPPWRELLRMYRRLEARGEIRGGRFVAGFVGEQFALPEAVGLLRQTRARPGASELACVSACDPLNLVGILTPGARVPAVAGARVLYRDGVPAAALSGGQVVLLDETLAPEQRRAARRALLREPGAMPPLETT